MKRIVKILLGIILGIFVLLLVLPVVFKGKIESIVKTEINKQVNARVDYESFTLSFLKGFPDAYVGLNGLSVTGLEPFEKDTLVAFNELSVNVNLFSALSGKIEVKSILLDQMKFKGIVLKDSTVNWDIVKVSDSELEEEEIDESSSSSFKVVLNSFKVMDAQVVYVDQTMNLFSRVDGIDIDMSGDMSANTTNIDLLSEVGDVMVEYEGVKYLNGARLGLDATINADLENMLFTMMENEFRVNGMALQLDGSVGVKEDTYSMDLSLGTKNTDFKSLLAMVPEAYMQDLEALKTDGKLELTAKVKGDYVDEDHLPAFNMVLEVLDAMIQYPDLPKSIDKVGVRLKVNNPGGLMDNTVANLEQFHFELGGNPFDASLLVTTPVSNLTFKGLVDGKIDLASLKDAMPLDSVELKGLIEANLSLDGNNELIEAGRYEDIKSNGTVSMSSFVFDSNDLPYSVAIDKAQMLFSPKYLELKSFDCRVGQSDFSLKGKLENYLNYALSDGTLRGKLVHHSDFINANEFLTESAETDGAVDDTTQLSVIEVPANLNLVFTSGIDHLLYDKLDVNNASGKIVVKDGAVVLDGLNMNTLGGQLMMDGQYNTADMNKPFIDFSFVGDNIDINTTANSFSMVDSMMPIAKNAVGLVSTKFKFYSVLGQDFMPVVSSVDGGGNIRSEGVEISGSKIQNGMAALLKNDSYKVMRAEDFNIEFVIEKGNIMVKPFKTKLFGKMVEVEGCQGVDQSMDYCLTMPFAREELAKMGGLMGLNLPTSGDDLLVDVMVKGTVSDPSLSLNLDKAKKQVGKELEKEAEKAVKKILEDPESKKKVEELTKKFKELF